MEIQEIAERLEREVMRLDVLRQDADGLEDMAQLASQAIGVEFALHLVKQITLPNCRVCDASQNLGAEL